MSTKVAGKAYFRIDGVQYQLRGNLTLSLAPVERETIVGMDSVHGYKEMPRSAFVELDITDSSGLSLAFLAAITDATITVELNNGKRYILPNAWATTAAELDVGEGSMKIRFEAATMQELTA